MSRVAGSRVLQAAQAVCRGQAALPETVLPGAVPLTRQYGTIPEYWGKESPYHPGTDFLGTPPDHLDRAAKRPVSPHVFEIDGKHFHYKMPVNAISSIMNRATGVALYGVVAGAGALSLTGDLPSVVAALQSSVLIYPVKAGVAFPLVYHYLGGLRHVLWDKWRYGMQSYKKDPLEPAEVDKSSYAVLGLSVAATLGLTVASF